MTIHVDVQKLLSTALVLFGQWRGAERPKQPSPKTFGLKFSASVLTRDPLVM